jgi:hypothetical protein
MQIALFAPVASATLGALAGLEWNDLDGGAWYELLVELGADVVARTSRRTGPTMVRAFAWNGIRWEGRRLRRVP